MRYQIFGNDLPAVTLTMEAGESIYTQSGGMAWMSDGFSMTTNTRGGLMKGLGRMFSGDSLFMATYTAQYSGAEITIASTLPGSIVAIELDGTREFICQKSAFLCATEGVQLSVAFTGGKAGFFGGEGFVMQRLSGVGLVFIEIDGTVVHKELAPGERLKVDTGSIAAFDSTVGYTAETVKGFKNVLFGGEGLFLSVLEGPGTVFLQTMNLADFANRLAPYMPFKRSE